MDRGLKSNDWFVVRNSKMPAVLVEVGFVSNPEEAKRLSSKAYLKKLADGIVAGISRFVTFFDSKSGFME
jgi:N-acetylmuramoyl-L-alanine amidase